MQTPVPPRAMPAHPHHPQPAPAGAEVDHWLAATLRALELLLWPVKAIGKVAETVLVSIAATLSLLLLAWIGGILSDATVARFLVQLMYRVESILHMVMAAH